MMELGEVAIVALVEGKEAEEVRRRSS